MEKELTLQLPDDVIEILRRRGEQSKRSPEYLAANWLTVTVRRLATDPLFQMAGAIRGLPTDDQEASANLDQTLSVTGG